MKNFQEKNKTIKADSQAAAAIQGVASLQADIISKEVQLAAFRNSMTDENPEVRTLLAGINKLKSQLNLMSGSGGVGVLFLRSEMPLQSVWNISAACVS